MNDDYQIAKYDRIYGGVCGGNTVKTKQSTVQNVDVIGRAETFIVQTVRVYDRSKAEDNGDYVFVQMLDADGAVTRMALPPKVSRSILAQYNSLTAKRRSIASKAVARARMERGELPGFMKKRKTKLP
jgi:hypothetical protein